MSQNLLCGTVLSLFMTTSSAAAATDVVDLALKGIGTGSVAEMKSRIFSLPITVLGSEHRLRAIAALPDSVREHRITEGKLWQKVERVTKPVIELHNRTEKVEVFLYRGRFPRGALWMGCLLLLSDTLVTALNDAELAGIVGHELSHAYFMDERRAAEKTQDDRLMRVIELKCDAAAMLTLKLLGADPRAHLKGIEKIRLLLKGEGLPKLDYKSHPTITERAQLSDRFRKLLEH